MGPGLDLKTQVKHGLRTIEEAKALLLKETGGDVEHIKTWQWLVRRKGMG